MLLKRISILKYNTDVILLENIYTCIYIILKLNPIEDKHEVNKGKKEMQITQKKNKDYQKTGENVEPNW